MNMIKGDDPFLAIYAPIYQHEKRIIPKLQIQDLDSIVWKSTASYFTRFAWTFTVHFVNVKKYVLMLNKYPVNVFRATSIKYIRMWKDLLSSVCWRVWKDLGGHSREMTEAMYCRKYIWCWLQSLRFIFAVVKLWNLGDLTQFLDSTNGGVLSTVHWRKVW